jgi:hypothetical protein
MKKVGSFIAIIFCATLTASTAWAAAILSVDRQVVTEGDSLTITLRVTEGEDMKAANFGPLQQDFEILSHRQSSNTSISNGVRESYSELTLTVMPRRTGTIIIAPISVGSSTSNAIGVEVGSARSTPQGTPEPIFLETEVSADTVYVQGQLLYTVRFYYAVNLENLNVTDLSIDNTLQEVVANSSFTRNVNGLTYNVAEIKYAIFPQRSGQLEIPEQTFSASKLQRRRSLFDPQRGQPVRLKTEPTSIQVLPVPNNAIDAEWLPAQNFSIEEKWSRDPATLQLGESATRSITLTAQGLMGAQIPPLLQPSPPGLKLYPEQPRVDNNVSETGLVSRRVETAAVVIADTGRFEIPEIRVPWWNVAKDRQEIATIPARIIEVSVPELNTPDANTTPVENTKASKIAKVDNGRGELVWQWLTAAAVMGWLLTTLWLLRRRTYANGLGSDRSETANPREAQLWKALEQACQQMNLLAIRGALLAWGDNALGLGEPCTIGAIQGHTTDTVLIEQLDLLERSLYSPGDSGAEPGKLLAGLKSLRKSVTKSATTVDGALPKLYQH